MWFYEILKDGKGKAFYKVGCRGHSNYCAGKKMKLDEDNQGF